MSATEVAATVHAAMDFPEFDSFMESERMQRALSEERVEKMIVPYLCKSPDRFFGSLVVLVYEPEEFEFEAVDIAGISGAADFGSSARRIGILNISGGKLFALDGQHRLHALRTVIGSRDVTPRLKLPIEGEYRDEVQTDELSVIFLPFESTEKARRIFNKINRYAKPTSQATNILTSEDDGLSIITRCLIGSDDPTRFGGTDESPLRLVSNGVHLIEREKNSLDTNAVHLTTLSTVYQSVRDICRATGHEGLSESDSVVRPEDSVLAAAYQDCVRWWRALLEGLTPYQEVLDDYELIIGARHGDCEYSLAFRPACQTLMIEALCKAHEKTRLVVETLVERLDDVPLRLQDDPWRGILIGSNGKMVLRHKALVTRLLTWCLIGDRVGIIEKSKLQADFAEARRDLELPVIGLPKAASD